MQVQSWHVTLPWYAPEGRCVSAARDERVAWDHFPQPPAVEMQVV